MTHTVQCQKLKMEAEGLPSPPYPGKIGEKIFNSISAKAWGMWLSHQTMLINEYKLSLIDKQSRDFLAKEMDKFLFGGGAKKPAGFVEEITK